MPLLIFYTKLHLIMIDHLLKCVADIICLHKTQACLAEHTKIRMNMLNLKPIHRCVLQSTSIHHSREGLVNGAKLLGCHSMLQLPRKEVGLTVLYVLQA